MIRTPVGKLCCDVLLERSLLEPIPEVRSPVDLQISLASAADLDWICPLYASDPYLFLGHPARDGSVPPSVQAMYADRLQRGELCFVARSQGQLAHVNWTCFSWGDALPDRPIRLLPHEIYTTDGITTEPFRGKNVHAVVLRSMLEHARSRGRTMAYTLAGTDRVASFKGLHRLGWQEGGRIYYWLYSNADKAIVLWRRGRLAPLNRPAEALNSLFRTDGGS